MKPPFTDLLHIFPVHFVQEAGPTPELSRKILFVANTDKVLKCKRLKYQI